MAIAQVEGQGVVQELDRDLDLKVDQELEAEERDLGVEAEELDQNLEMGEMDQEVKAEEEAQELKAEEMNQELEARNLEEGEASQTSVFPLILTMLYQYVRIRQRIHQVLKTTSSNRNTRRDPTDTPFNTTTSITHSTTQARH
ncbi:hypothetical protein BGZ96_012189 [Linnemannia gamsii]|uniref:Uncharacterized protein n=1 Tax=Linnemannia gamsii TaxID=64522 RepID=A0ABQ7JR59_9FUNG|nr:hypothetical protein BGZ96_012189 [Linnemannia gamsii]